MKSNKELVYDFIKKCTSSVQTEDNKGVTTQYLSNRLGMQRTNISSILNSLVKEGSIEKINGRPVLYKLKQDVLTVSGEQSCFNKLIGCDGSLKNAVQLAKAAILYPQQSLHSLILGPEGSGKSFFANIMYDFAKENKIIRETASFVKFNCDNYSENSALIVNDLFGDDNNSVLAKAQGGVLFIDNIELLSVDARNYLIQLIENNSIEINGVKRTFNGIIICSMNDKSNKSFIKNYSKYISIKIELTSLNQRTLKERFDLIKHFFTIEAEKSNKTIQINPEVMIGLLLYHCERNIKQLKKDIQLGCANAYVREFHTDNTDILVHMSDFEYYIRTGYLNLKNHRLEVKELISENYNYAFSKEQATIIAINQDKNSKKQTMYDWIDEKFNELSARGIEKHDINTILSINIENEFKQYSRRLSEQIIDKAQLAQIVNSKIINLVSNFLEEATIKFNRVYPVSVFYGLCLHLNSTLSRQNKSQRLSNEQIMEIIKYNQDEYAYCVKFVSLIEKEFKISLPIDEVIFITMFLAKENLVDEDKKHPVLLIALHGNSAAHSIVDVVNFMSGYPAYAYDMPLDTSTTVAYEELKMLILKIHKGKGIFVIYDMGSFKAMFDMISTETGIEIKSMQLPLTLLALDCSRKVMLDLNLNEIYEDMIETYENMMYVQKNTYYKVNSTDIILTLCMSGEGAAIQTKKFIEKHVELKDVEIIPLAISNEKFLIEEVNKIKEKHNILCVVGSYDPRLFGIKYIPITDIFQNKAKELKVTLQLNSNITTDSETLDDDLNVIFNHLSEELEMVNMEILRSYLPIAINNFIKATNCNLTKDQQVSLMIHVACCIEHMKKHSDIPINIYADEIISENIILYKAFKKSFEILESEFQVTFDNNEIANMISIINKSFRR